MFEGEPPCSAEALPLEEPQEGERLRPMSWRDLVAVVTQAGVVREAIEGGAAASFDASSARCIAAHHNGKHSVNPEDSGSGKGPEGNAEPAVHGAERGVARE